MTNWKNVLGGAVLWAGIGATTLALATSSGMAAEKLKVAKSNSSAFAFAIVDVGMKKGIFAKRGLDLEVTALPGSARVVQAMTTGAIDIGLGTGVEMSFVTKGAPIKAVFAIISAPDQVVVTGANSAIKTADDFKGKRFAVSSKTAVSAWLVGRLATSKGWGPNGVEYTIAPSYQTALALLKTGQIDGMTFDYSAALQAQRAGDLRIVLNLSDFIHDFIGNAAYATDDLIKDRPQVLRDFVAAWLDTIAFIKANRNESVKLFAEVLGIEPDIAGKVYDQVSKTLVADGKFDPKALDVLKKSYVELEILDKEPDMTKAYTEAFLPKQ
jgi:ABC-type nitrate/sulfonate/bicarbonate transport system substrate-binding protein